MFQPPREFQDLGEFAEWLFLQTGAPQRGCRMLCMDLFSSIAGPALPAGALRGVSGTSGAARWFRTRHLDAHKGNLAEATAAFMAPPGGPACPGPGPATRWLAEVAATLQWCTWALAQGLFVPGEVDLAGLAHPGEAHRLRLAPYIQGVAQCMQRRAPGGRFTGSGAVHLRPSPGYQGCSRGGGPYGPRGRALVSLAAAVS